MLIQKWAYLSPKSYLFCKNNAVLRQQTLNGCASSPSLARNRLISAMTLSGVLDIAMFTCQSMELQKKGRRLCILRQQSTIILLYISLNTSTLITQLHNFMLSLSREELFHLLTTCTFVPSYKRLPLLCIFMIKEHTSVIDDDTIQGHIIMYITH